MSVRPWNLRNIHEALYFNANNEVTMRTGFTGNINIGNVTVPGNITVGGGNINVDNFPTTIGVTQDTDPWNVTGNVNAAVTGTVIVSSITSIIQANANVSGTVSITGNATVEGNVGILGNVNVTQGTDPWVISGNVTASLPTNTSINTNVVLAETLTDAFGRLRISNPFTLFDSALSGEERGDFDTATANGGTVTFNYDANVRELFVTTANGSQVERETYRVFNYQPGKSLLILNTFAFASAQEFLTQRVGYFDSDNGIFLELANSTLNFVIRSSSSGSLVEERVDQTAWNVDPMDGTGPSGKTLHIEAPQIFWMDVEWLGVGTVRCGFVIDGQFIVCHKFHHANIMDGASPKYPTTYMSSANLPIRYSIFNTGTTSANATMQQICSTVISEGGYSPQKITHTAGTGITPKRLTTAGTYYPVASIRLAANNRYSIVRVSQIDVLSPTVNYYRWVVLKNASLTNANWSSNSSTVRVEVDTNATAVSNGIEIQSGYASSRELTQLDPENFQGWLGFALNNAPITFTLAIVATSNNADVLAQLGWQEIA